jgi:hypothetical protein
MKDHLKSGDYATASASFEMRAAATKILRLKTNLLKLAKINRELAEQTEHRQRMREVLRRRTTAR